MFGRGPRRMSRCQAPWTSPVSRARVWKRLSWRGPVPTRPEKANDVAGGARLSHRFGPDRRRSSFKRAALAIGWLLSCSLLFGASGCARLTVRIAPERTYQRSWLTLKRGDLPAAAAEADVGLQSFPSINSDWHWRFSTLKAEILLRQGLTTEAL